MVSRPARSARSWHRRSSAIGRGRVGASGLTTSCTTLFQPPCRRCLVWMRWLPAGRDGIRYCAGSDRRPAPHRGVRPLEQAAPKSDRAAHLADRPRSLCGTIRRLKRARCDSDTTILLATAPDAVPVPWRVRGGAGGRAWDRGDAPTRSPVAAHHWTMGRGPAILHKRAHDETSRAQSPGTVLTARMIRRLVDEEQVTTLDFGHGGDPCKRGRAAERQQRAGVVIASPCHSLRAVALLRWRS